MAHPDYSRHGDRGRTGQRRAWRRTLERAGVPPRFQKAKMSNCESYAEQEGKTRAFERAQTFCEEGNLFQRDARRFCLLLTGSYGTGKTWLGTAVFKRLLWSHPDVKQGLWRKFYAFVREVQGTYSAAADRSVDQVLGGYQNTDLLFLDDLGDLERPVQSDDRRRLVYEVLDARNDQLKPTIITTNLSADQLAEQFGERTFQRVMEMCALVEMEGANLRDAS